MLLSFLPKCFILSIFISLFDVVPKQLDLFVLELYFCVISVFL